MGVFNGLSTFGQRLFFPALGVSSTLLLPPHLRRQGLVRPKSTMTPALLSLAFILYLLTDDENKLNLFINKRTLQGPLPLYDGGIGNTRLDANFTWVKWIFESSEFNDKYYASDRARCLRTFSMIFFFYYIQVMTSRFYTGAHHRVHQHWLRFASVLFFQHLWLWAVPFSMYVFGRWATEDLLNDRNDMGRWQPIPRYAGFACSALAFQFIQRTVPWATLSVCFMYMTYLDLCEWHGGGPGAAGRMNAEMIDAVARTTSQLTVITPKIKPAELPPLSLLDYGSTTDLSFDRYINFKDNFEIFGRPIWDVPVKNHDYIPWRPSPLEELKAEMGLRPRDPRWINPLKNARLMKPVEKGHDPTTPITYVAETPEDAMLSFEEANAKRAKAGQPPIQTTKEELRRRVPYLGYKVQHDPWFEEGNIRGDERPLPPRTRQQAEYEAQIGFSRDGAKEGTFPGSWLLNNIPHSGGLYAMRETS